MAKRAKDDDDHLSEDDFAVVDEEATNEDDDDTQVESYDSDFDAEVRPCARVHTCYYFFQSL